MNRVFTHRADRVAKAIERQGIRATYELHDRLLSNRTSREHFGEAPSAARRRSSRASSPTSASTALASGSFADLFPDGGRGSALEEQRDRFVAVDRGRPRRGRRARAGPAGQGVRRAAPELRRRARPRRSVVPGRRRRTACSTSRTRTSRCGRSSSTSTSGTRCPQPAAAERISSQRWHRDYNDKHLLKVFLYLVDVDEEHGPVPVRRREPARRPVRGRVGLAAARPELPDRGGARGAHPRRRRCRRSPGPAGTLLFCNTAGFHRGGFSTTEPRVLATATYSSPASLASLTVRSYAYTGAARRARRADAVRSQLTVHSSSGRTTPRHWPAELPARRVALARVQHLERHGLVDRRVVVELREVDASRSRPRRSPSPRSAGSPGSTRSRRSRPARDGSCQRCVDVHRVERDRALRVEHLDLREERLAPSQHREPDLDPDRPAHVDDSPAASRRASSDPDRADAARGRCPAPSPPATSRSSRAAVRLVQVVARRPPRSARRRRGVRRRSDRAVAELRDGLQLWETNSTVRPVLPSSSMRPRQRRWNSASPTASTSSTNRISGSRCAATANARRTYMPLE